MYPKARAPAVDIDPCHRPGIPREPNPRIAQGSHWTQPEPQRAKMPVPCSASRRFLPAVFGTAQPPKGLSGMLRRIAWQMAEHRPGRERLLRVADRVDVLEHDLRRWPLPLALLAGAAVCAVGTGWASERRSGRRSWAGRTRR